MDRKAFIDSTVAKVISRKFLVWLTATTALFTGFVPADAWVEICLIYIGSQAAVDMLSEYLRNKK